MLLNFFLSFTAYVTMKLLQILASQLTQRNIRLVLDWLLKLVNYWLVVKAVAGLSQVLAHVPEIPG